MIKREKYMKPIREFYDGDLIKVITGIRRCGKSVILKQILEEIKERSDNIIFLDFEDTAVLNAIPDEMAKAIARNHCAMCSLTRFSV